MSQTPMPIVKRHGTNGWVRRRSLPFVLSGLMLAPSLGLAELDVRPQAVAVVSKAPPPLPKKKGMNKDKERPEKGRSPNPQALLPRPSAVMPPPIVPRSPEAEKLAEKHTGAYRPYVEVSGLGLLVGDYQIQPRLVLGTDNRLDDVNIRERVLRDEMDAREAQRRGELKEDPITQWLRTRGRSGLPGIDPGFQVAYAVQRVLRGSIRLAPMLEYAPPPHTPPAEKQR